MKLTKGMVVDFVYKKQTLLGIVETIRGNSATVVIQGGTNQIRGPLASFIPSETKTLVVPEPPPDPMKDWGVVKYKKAARFSEETEAFSADITFQGQVVLDATNRGRGGPNRYQMVGGALLNKTLEEYRRPLNDLTAACRLWASIHGSPNESSECVDLWISFYVHERPYGISGADFWRKMRRVAGSC